QHERALGLAEVRLWVHGKHKLVDLKARVVKRDGSVHELKREQVLSDESSARKDSETTSNGHFFRLPDVQPGDVIEYAYVVEYPYLDIDDEAEVVGEYPLREYRAWIDATKELILEG